MFWLQKSILSQTKLFSEEIFMVIIILKNALGFFNTSSNREMISKKQFYAYIETHEVQILFFDCDANLVITWSRNPHIKTPIPGKPSKSGLIGVWHKDNLYLGTSTIGNGDPRPTNIDSRTRSIKMTPRRQLFFDKSFFSSLENHGREIISPTHIHTQSAANKKFY